jgi:hypothetical protein
LRLVGTPDEQLGEIPMSIIDVERQLKAEGLAHAKRMVETTLEGWDLLTWNELLADDVILSLKLGTLDISRFGDLRGASGDLEVTGKAQAREVLQSIYGDFRKDLAVTTEVVSGYDVILLGNLAVHKTEDDVESFPVGIYMLFDSQVKIRKLTIAIVDLQALMDAIRKAAQTGPVSNS